MRTKQIAPMIVAVSGLVVSSASVADGQRRPNVPLTQGLVLTWVSSVPREPDYESRLEIVTADRNAVTLRSSWNRGSRPGAERWQHADRVLMHDVRRTTHAFYTSVYEKDPMDYTGWTFRMASAAIIGDLRKRGRANVRMSFPEFSREPYEGTLTRGASEMFPVVFNGQRETLRGLRATGRLKSPEAAAAIPSLALDLLFLDDSLAPWILAVEVRQPNGARSSRQLVRLSYRPDVEAQLARNCRASVYDIYFASASADLDPASAPTLSAIGHALADHPDWRVTIVGHTDSIGTASANVDLSRRRAEAARNALVTGFGVPAGSLRAEGRGESQPIDDNGTTTGRARNRRVDLLRGCT